MASLTPSGTPVNATPSHGAPTAASTFDVKAAAIEVARLLSDDRCSDIVVLDVRGMTSVQDFVILASGTSDRQMRSAAADVKNLLPKLGSSVYRTSIDEQGTWIVVDCVDTVIHIFEPNTRAYYDLESMWGDAPKVEWLREGQRPYAPDQDTEEPAQGGDTDEPAAGATESSEPDADLELTTGTAQEFVEQVRASVSLPPAKPTAKAKTKAKAKSVKNAPVKSKAKPKAAKAAKKSAASRPVKKTAKKAASKPVRKAAAKPAKKTAS
ncbi:MAG TPA: ribosome silencing factor, partial [Phycisphaerales bacterium]|nr:ribosome silencing factor [Phycisphaerales bacterium]